MTTISPLCACSKCGAVLPLTTEYFYQSTIDRGASKRCKACLSAQAKAWKAENRSRINERQRSRRAAQQPPKPAVDTSVRTCSLCGETFPATTEHFYPKGDGLNARCKPCVRRATSEWGKANRERANAQSRDWIARNPEKRKAICQRYYQTHSAEIAVRVKAWRRRVGVPEKRRIVIDRREHNRAYHRAWRLRNPERLRAIQRRSARNRPWAARVSKARRRALEAQAPGHYTTADVRRQYEAQAGCCYWCGVELDASFHADHYIPLSRGGSNWPDNIVCACASCNLRKHNKMPDEFRALIDPR